MATDKEEDDTDDLGDGGEQTATATETAQPEATTTAAGDGNQPSPADISKMFREASEKLSKAEDRERNATEALRTANERNREAKEEAARARQAAEEARTTSSKMEQAVHALAEADPDSPIAKLVAKFGGGDGGGGNGLGGAVNPQLKAALDGLTRELGEQRQQLAGMQYDRAVANLDDLSHRLWKNEHGVGLSGVIDEAKFVKKLRREVLSDHVVQKATDGDAIERRARELARELAEEVGGYARNGVKDWKEKRREKKATAAPTGRESAPAGAGPGKKRVVFNGDMESYLRAKGITA